jgi:4-hydroxy-3-methylbut-2-en-1-yl diphosphate synthase IspG/GcpE
MDAKCDCQRCGNPIAFPVEMDGNEVECPHCNRTTTLNISVPKSSNKKETSEENKLAFILLPIFIIGCVIFFIIKAQQQKEQGERNLEEMLNPVPTAREQMERAIEATQIDEDFQRTIKEINREGANQESNNSYSETNSP